MILVLTLLACGAKNAPEAVPEPSPAEAPATGTLVGAWTGAPCGPRAYPRKLRLDADHTWAAQDLVAPCPPDVQCVWSGVVNTKGTWAEDSHGIALTETGDGGTQAQPRPTRMALADEGATATEGDQRCPYTRDGD